MPNRIKNLKSKICLKGKNYINRRGFSLIELLFAMSFLTIIILGVVSLQTSNLAMANRQNNEIQANFYANQGLQIVKGIGYAGITGACPPATSPCEKVIKKDGTYSLVAKDTTNTGLITGTPFSRYIKAETVTNLPDAYKVTSIIKWEDSTGEHSAEAKLIVYLKN